MSHNWKLDRMNDPARFSGGHIGHGKIAPMEERVGHRWPLWLWFVIGAGIVALSVGGYA